LNKLEIQAILPHRDDMLLIEEASVKEGKACASYRFRGDFPDSPVVPGVILCEILAQSAAVLLRETDTAGSLPYLTGLDKVRFRSPVHPGDVMETECVITRAKPPFYLARGQGFVNGKLCVEANYSFALVKR
jgi:3-hydroxyacyl-[acyl-carrier-protein] dehydratase